MKSPPAAIVGMRGRARGLLRESLRKKEKAARRRPLIFVCGMFTERRLPAVAALHLAWSQQRLHSESGDGS